MKNYNPFKMWGSWIFAFLGSGVGYTIREGFCLKNCINDAISINYMIWGAIIGFLIGWGINSLFRSINEKQ
jgi:hypothetical protein